MVEPVSFYLTVHTPMAEERSYIPSRSELNSPSYCLYWFHFGSDVINQASDLE